IFVYCTLVVAFHSRAIISHLKVGVLIGIDQDDHALEVASQRLVPNGNLIHLVKSNFSRLDEVLDQLGYPPVNGVLFDLGVSSPQLDEAHRGFSYQHDAPLDMRMDQSQAQSAYDIVNHWSEEEISRIIHEYGEEKFARRIA